MIAIAPRTDPGIIPDAAVPLRAALDAPSVGGKAYNLARLLHLGAFVPDGFALPVDCFELHIAPVRSRVDAIAARVVAADVRDRPAVARAAAMEIRALIRDLPLSASTRQSLRMSTAPLLAQGDVVVRSSAVGEDSVRESYAGQFDSFLGLTSIDDIERAVVACWASCWSERALTYRAARDLTAAGMAVVVQQQVRARASGVMFTRTSTGQLLIEYVGGLGDALVSGEVTPSRLVLSRDGEHCSRVARGDVDDEVATWLVTSAPVLAQLADAAEVLEEGLGGPQDVEWCVDDRGVLYLVQSRPITAPVAIRPSVAGGRPVRWSNANVNENFPEPLSPFLYSLATAGYANYFRQLADAFGLSARRIAAMDDALDHIVGVHGGRIYYNLTSIHTVLRHAPAGGWLVEAFNRFVGATGDEGGVEPPPASRWRTWLELVRVAVTSARAFRSLGDRVTAFEHRVDDLAARAHPDTLAGLELRDLRRLLADVMEIRCRGWTGAALADAAAMLSYATLHRLVGRAYGGGPPGALHNTLLQAIPDLVSSEPVHRLWDLSRAVRDNPDLLRLFEDDSRTVMRRIRREARFADFRARLDRYLDEWGFRCSSELMLTLPSYQERPEPLIDTIRAYARVGGPSPVEALARQAAERDRQVARLLDDVQGRPLSAWMPLVSLGGALTTMLGWTQASIGYRERARLKQALLYSRCRRLALAIGHRLTQRDVLDEPDDVFWLSVREVDELASGHAMFPHDVRELVALRRRAHTRVSEHTPPDAFTLPEGSYLPVDDAGWTGDASTGSDALTGTGACGGHARGRATVLGDVAEAGRLEVGDILVTRQTDPGWAPVFFLIRGLVIERGGMLSHGAIVAREFGIPCVVGVRDATRRIADGATIDVDGDLGVVRVDG